VRSYVGATAGIISTMFSVRTLLIAVLLGSLVNAEEPLPTFPFDQHLLVPVRIHLLRAPGAVQADCKLSAAEVERIFFRARQIWQQAGIQLVLESIVEEEVDDFELAKSLTLETPLATYRRLRPPATRQAPLFHVYYIHRFSVNGVYMDRASIFVQATARLRPVAGGIDEPLPRVTAHEIGHGLGLQHRQDTTNLLASGTTGTLLNKAEVELARMTAQTFDWVHSSTQVTAQAEAAWERGKRAEARKLYEPLALVPGESPLKQRAMERLKEQP